MVEEGAGGGRVQRREGGCEGRSVGRSRVAGADLKRSEERRVQQREGGDYVPLPHAPANARRDALKQKVKQVTCEARWSKDAL